MGESEALAKGKFDHNSIEGQNVRSFPYPVRIRWSRQPNLVPFYSYSQIKATSWPLFARSGSPFWFRAKTRLLPIKFIMARLHADGWGVKVFFFKLLIFYGYQHFSFEIFYKSSPWPCWCWGPHVEADGPRTPPICLEGSGKSFMWLILLCLPMFLL